MAGCRLAGSWLKAGWRWMVCGWLAGWMLAGWLASFKNISQFSFKITVVQSQKLVKSYFFGGLLAAGWWLTGGWLAG